MIKKIRKFIVALALVFTCLLSCLPFGALQANADGISIDGGYTSALDDLKNDASFDENRYPIIENSYTLEVLTIAESKDNELFVYVYQPNPEYGKYVASSINISATEDDSLKIDNYPLSLVNFDGVFQKYLVENITLPTSETRYYDIISIYRVFDEKIDEELNDDNDNTINEVVFKVGKLYTLTTTENGVSVKVDDIETITVTEMYVGFLRYPEGFFSYDACDYHYVAFSTERPMEELLYAEVKYSFVNYADMTGSAGAYTSYFYPCECGNSDYYDPCETENCKPFIDDDIAKLNFGDSLDYDDGWFSRDYSFKVIEKTSEFLKSSDISRAYELGPLGVETVTKINEESKGVLERQQWCLRFLLSDYDVSSGSSMVGHWYKACSTRVSNVTLLRLKFKTNGDLYDLGVVSNKQTGSLTPDNETKTELTLNDTFKMIMAVLLLILLFVVLSPVMNVVFSLIGFVLKLPFKLLRFLFGRR